MCSIISTLAKRLRSSHTSLSTSLMQRPQSLSLATAKQRTANWEPSLNLKALDFKTTPKPKPKPRDTNGADEQNMTFMTTYSAFDPGATHPLLLRSAFLLPPSDLAAWNGLHAIKCRGPHMEFDAKKSAILRPAIECWGVEAETRHEGPRTWPYALPGPLRPKAGTTWDAMYGDGEGRGQPGEKLGVLQRVLYGDPEPGRKW